MDIGFMRGCKLFAGVPDAKLAAFLDAVPCREQGFSKREVVRRRGDAVDSIAVVRAGTLRSEIVQPGGRAHLLRVFAEHDALFLETVFSRLVTSPFDLVAASDGRLAWFALSTLFVERKYMGGCNNRLKKNVASLLADELIRAYNRSLILSQPSIRAKVLAYLAIVTERMRSPAVDIRMTQVEFARYLNAERPSLSTELNRMRAEGLIDYRGKRYTLLAPLPPALEPFREAFREPFHPGADADAPAAAAAAERSPLP